MPKSTSGGLLPIINGVKKSLQVGVFNPRLPMYRNMYRAGEKTPFITSRARQKYPGICVFLLQPPKEDLRKVPRILSGMGPSHGIFPVKNLKTLFIWVFCCWVFRFLHDGMIEILRSEKGTKKLESTICLEITLTLADIDDIYGYSWQFCERALFGMVKT